MKRFLLVAGVVGIVLVLLTATSFAARAPQGTMPQGSTPQGSGTQAPGVSVTPATPDTGANLGQRLGGWFQGMMGRFGMRGGSGMRGGMMWSGGSTSSPTTTMHGHGMTSTGVMTGTMTGEGWVMGQGAMMAGATMHEDVEKMLGMTHDELYRQLAAGKTLVQIAADKGLTEQQVIDGIMAGRKTALDQSVASGWMTQQQADAMLADMASQVKTMANTSGMNYGNAGWSMMWNGQTYSTPQTGQPSQGSQAAPNGQVQPTVPMGPGFGMGRGMHH